jgi:nitrogen regulatory protein PII
MHSITLLRVVCAKSLVPEVLSRLEEAGMRGWTLSEAAGFGEHGHRSGETEDTSNVVVEALADESIAERALKRIHDELMAQHPVIAYLLDARVLRREKFL